MHYNEHAPAHLRATYGEHWILMGIDPVVILKGALPTWAPRMVIGWAAAHQPGFREK
ncbi:MAG TPA: DUF4160 domain-containing protein [Chloroflexota bacterium]